MCLSRGHYRHSMGSFAHRNRPPNRPLEFACMHTEIDHYELDAALRLCGSRWTAAQAHGLLCGRLAAQGPVAGADWIAQVLEGNGGGDPSAAECESLLRALLGETYRRLADRQSAFAPLLPEDDEARAVRTSSLAEWCEGFLHGLVSAATGPALQQRLASEPLSEIIRDLGQITRAGVSADDPAEEEEAAYAELVEYLRVSAQLAYEELADLRGSGVVNGAESGDAGTVH